MEKKADDVKLLATTVDVLRRILEGELELSWAEATKTSYFQILPVLWQPKNLILYRASFLSEGDPRINVRSRYSYPPSKYCKRDGRCNLAAYPVFYGTTDFLGAIQEAIITTGSNTVLDDFDHVIFVSQWELIEKKQYIAYDIAVAYRTRSNSDIELLRAEYHRLLGELFRSRNGHGVSSGFAFMLMFGIWVENNLNHIFEGGCQAMIYPTVVKDGRFTNYAIQPCVIDNDFVLKRVFKVRIGLFNWYNVIRQSNGLPIEIVQVGKPIRPSGKLLSWSTPDPADVRPILFGMDLSS